MVRIMLAYRLWILQSRNRYLVIPPLIANGFVIGGSVAFEVQIASLEFGSHGTVQRTFYVASAAGVVADIYLTVSFVIILRNLLTGLRRTDLLLRVLILYGVNTFLVTSICELLSLISFAALPKRLLYYAFFILSPKLMFNALLATYNARKGMREMSRGPNSAIAIPLSTLPSTRATDSIRTPDNTALEIHVHKMTE
ncbi:hypothetical protein CERSUDRAFT_108546, partial [Gelatoporia subvermispora B]